MRKDQYLALLRGINVGGNNVIRMADLKACFEKMGFSDVATFIQSGNVLFSSAKKDSARLAIEIEEGLSERFDYQSRLVIISHSQLKNIVEKALDGFGQDAEIFKNDLSSHEGLALMIEGINGGGWIYNARIVDKGGPLLTQIVKDLYAQTRQKNDDR